MSLSIDARGKRCPIPVILTKQAMADGADEIAVTVDNAAAVENLKRLADSQGFSVSAQAQGGDFTLTFLRSTPGAPPDMPLPAPNRHTAIFVGRDVIGSGDRELGTNLMRMFFYTLAQSEDLPHAVLFMNDGVKLPALDGQVAEHLKALQAQGVEILVCGTCLDFYGLSNQLQVGTVSNMYDILSQMQAAAKVITV